MTLFRYYRFEDEARWGSTNGLHLDIACLRFLIVCLHAEDGQSVFFYTIF